MSRKLLRVSRRRAASACGDAESSTSSPVGPGPGAGRPSAGRPSDRRRSRSSVARRAKRTRASAEKGRPSSGARRVEEGVQGVGERDRPPPGRCPRRPRPAVRRRRPPRPRSAAPPRWTSRRARRPRSARSRGPMRQRGPVSRRTSEALAPGSWSTSQHGDEVGDLREVQQAGQADDLDRHVAGDQLALDLGEVPGGAAQDGDLAGRPCPCARGGRGSRRASRSPRRAWAAGRSGPCRRARRRGRGAAPRPLRACARSGSARPLARSRRRPPLRRFSLRE